VVVQQVWTLVKVNLKKLAREPANLFLMLIFPAVLTLAFGVAFGALSGGETESINMFYVMAPGLFAYACIFIIMTVAQSFTDDREHGMLKRINLTPTRSFEFMGSHIISNMITSILQVCVVFTMAFLMGYRPLGGVEGVFMAFVFTVLLSLCSVGFGLITASVSKSAGAATGIAFIFILPQMFFGTFLPLNETTEIIGLFLPSFYATNAITLIFNGASIISSEILSNLAVLSLFSVLITIIGIISFKKYGKN
jgi:ABC-2 type transport system permease protein